jgi:ribosomal protein S18 acetylase RimI-like enzyme
VDNLTIRRGTVEDSPVLARHRCEMFSEMGVLNTEGYKRMMPESTLYFQEAIRNKAYVAWVVCDGEAVVAGGGMQVNAIPPRPGPGGAMLRRGPQGLIVNVYVEREYRRRGVAERLMVHMIESARADGFATLTLHASDAGRPLYERLGFTPTTEMRLFL